MHILNLKPLSPRKNQSVHTPYSQRPCKRGNLPSTCFPPADGSPTFRLCWVCSMAPGVRKANDSDVSR